MNSRVVYYLCLCIKKVETIYISKNNIQIKFKKINQFFLFFNLRHFRFK
jgi:hypothetical protein